MLISDVVQDSPAEKAGIAAGDIITNFDSTKVNNPQDMRIGLPPIVLHDH